MQTYCLSCRKYTDDIGSEKVIMTNNRQKSRCANCMFDKSRVLKSKSNKKANKTKPKLFIY